MVLVSVLIEEHSFEVVTVGCEKELARSEALNSALYTHITQFLYLQQPANTDH